jgi:hypothetical protein
MVIYLHDLFRIMLVLRNTIVHCLILLPFKWIFIIIIIIIVVRTHSLYYKRCVLSYVVLKR